MHADVRFMGHWCLFPGQGGGKGERSRQEGWSPKRTKPWRGGGAELAEEQV